MTSSIGTIPQSERDPAKIVFLLRQLVEQNTNVSGSTTQGTYPIWASTNGHTLIDGGGSVNALAFSGVDPTGTNDSADGLQAAWNAAQAAGRYLYVPAGTYKLTNTRSVSFGGSQSYTACLISPYSPTFPEGPDLIPFGSGIIGDGPGLTVLNCTNTTGDVIGQMDVVWGRYEGITITRPAQATNGYGLNTCADPAHNVGYCDKCIVRDVHLVNHGVGILCGGGGFNFIENVVSERNLFYGFQLCGEWQTDRLYAALNGSHGFNISSNLVASFTASISGTTLTVTAMTSGIVAAGTTVTGTGVPAGLVVQAWGTGGTTGKGGTGTYALGISGGTVTSRSMKASLAFACGQYRGFQTFANGGYGLFVVATSTADSISTLRVSDFFLGGDTLGEIFLQSYGITPHMFTNGYCEGGTNVNCIFLDVNNPSVYLHQVVASAGGASGTALSSSLAQSPQTGDYSILQVIGGSYNLIGAGTGISVAASSKSIISGAEIVSTSGFAVNAAANFLHLSVMGCRTKGGINIGAPAGDYILSGNFTS